MSQSYAKSPAAERKFTTREMVLVGMFAAVLAVISQISLPMPTGVPITIQVFGVALVGAETFNPVCSKTYSLICG